MTLLQFEQINNVRQTAQITFRERNYLEMFFHNLKILELLKKREISPKHFRSIFNKRPGNQQLNMCRSPWNLMNFGKKTYIPAELY